MFKIFLSFLMLLAITGSCNQKNKSDHTTDLTNTTEEATEPKVPKTLVPTDRVQNDTLVDTEGSITTKPEESPAKKIVDLPKKTVADKEVEEHEETSKEDDPLPEQADEKEIASSKTNHKIWDDVLKQYVSGKGQVNYKGLKADRRKLDQYIEELKNLPIQPEWSRNEKLAYWTNAYNAFTIDLILKNYPLKSIMDLGKPWDEKFIEIDGKSYSLNQIEHEIVRPTFKDPRIHFAFVCAAKSCPKLLNAAYFPETIQSQFDVQTKHFINQSGKNEISNDAVKISQLFNWYADDFKSKGSIIEFLNRYSQTQIDSGAKVEFLEYDWDLNE